jgi:hypothetical protein
VATGLLFPQSFTKEREMNDGAVLLVIALFLTLIKVVKRAYIERANLITTRFGTKRERWLVLFAYAHEMSWYLVAAYPVGWTPLEAVLAYVVLKGLYALLTRAGELLAETTMGVHGYGVWFIRLLWLVEVAMIVVGYAILVRVDPVPGNGPDPRWAYLPLVAVLAVIVYQQQRFIQWLRNRKKQIVGVFPGGPGLLLNTTLSAMRNGGPVAPGTALQAVAEYILYWPVHRIILYPHQGAIRKKREGRRGLVQRIREYSALRSRRRRKR